mmetsp:Transcript_8570/g.28084  ORF Transcript_8570/g.28084 Transcript_8570/m.28084 type:complete len:543 (+) Transcript_8570:10-1638(+)
MEAFVPGPSEALATALLPAVTTYCCECGVEMERPNKTNTCVQCLTSRIDVTEGIPRSVNVYRCRRCGVYLAGNEQWLRCDVESKELMALCLKKIRGLKKVTTVDCAWVWTEPNSMRLKLKLTVQKEIFAETILQKGVVVEFVVKNQQCTDCNAQFNNMSWKASVQVRQRVRHKRTFFYLEQVILKKQMQARAVKIEQFKDGLDFFFKEKNDAVRFASFVEEQVPCKSKQTKKLVTADLSSNIFHHQYTAIVELATACKDDLVVLSKTEARRLALPASGVVLVKSVNKSIKLVDPSTGRLADLETDFYFRSPPDVLLTGNQLVDFVVLDVEVVPPPDGGGGGNSWNQEVNSTTSKKKKRRRDDAAVRKTARGFVAEVVLAREKDLGVNDDKTHCRTHLGALLRAGDVVKGYDLKAANFPAGVDVDAVPDVVLVRKKLADQRKFRLRQLDDDDDAKRDNKLVVEQTQPLDPDHRHDYETFLDQLQSDRDMRTNVNLYRVNHQIAQLTVGGGASSSVDVLDDQPPVEDPDALKVDELLDDLDINK